MTGMRIVVVVAALLAFSTAVARADVAPRGLPADWNVVSRGPAGGVVYQGRIPNGFAPWDHRPSAVYLPPGFVLTRRYPVVYLLSGMPGDPASFWDGLQLATVADRLIASARTRPFIAVIPAGGPIVNPEAGEWAGVWETYLVDDVVPWADAHLPTDPAPAARALEGLCAGGFGAVDIGLRHPGLFGTLGSWEGYFAPVFHDGPFARATQQELEAHDPSLLVRLDAAALRASGVRFYVSVGGNHAQILRRWSLDFAGELQTLRLPHELWLLPAAERGHFWRATLPSALVYAGTGFRARRRQALATARSSLETATALSP
jgi:enterochelin esterase-like enzyme